MPSLKTLKDRGHKIPFNPAKQHAANTLLTVECAECSEPRIVYAARKISASEKKNFHIVIGSALFTCGALLAEFKSIDLITKKLNVYTSCSHVQTYHALSQLRLFIILRTIQNVVHTVVPSEASGKR